MPNHLSVTVIGHTTRAPELRYTPKGTAVADVGVAVNRTWKDDQGRKQERVTFLDVEVWGRTAEVAVEFLRKGHAVFFEGRIENEEWDDKTTGQKRRKMKIVAEEMQLLTPAAGGRPS